mgnify:CR=1 FL=1
MKITIFGSGYVGLVAATCFAEVGNRVTCVDVDSNRVARLSDGEQLWTSFGASQGDRPASWGNIFTVKQGDRYFLANDFGELIIANLKPSGYEEISRAKLIEPTHKVSGRLLVWSHPAFANRSVYLRNDNEIRCYSLAKPE